MPRSRRVRILRVISRLNAGGPARHVVWANEGLDARGYETLLVTGCVPPGEDDATAFARQRGVALAEVPELSREIAPRQDRQALAHVTELIEGFRPDVVHTHTSKAGFLGRWAARRINRLRRRRGEAPIRVVHTFHGNVLSGYFSPARTLLFRTLERHLGRGASDAILVLSAQQREEIVERFRVAPAAKALIVPLAIDLGSFDQPASGAGFAAEMSLAARDFVVGIVGRIAPIKNHELFLRTAALVRRDLPNARFVVVGGGERLVETRRLAAELGLAECVRFAGVRTDLAPVYATFDAVALTSLNEGTPLSLIEAMAAGRPIVATDVGGVRDLLTCDWSGDPWTRTFSPSAVPRGLLAPSGDPESLAAALRRVASEPGLAEALGAAGRAYAHRFHGLPRLLDDLEAVYGRILSR